MDRHDSRGGALLEQRIDDSDTALAQFAAQWEELPHDVADALESGSVVVTGAGGSEGPARYLAARLCEAQRIARFAPLSAFWSADPISATRVPMADTLVLFSQGLSPNARLALRRTHDYARVVVLTSRDRDAAIACGLDRAVVTAPHLSWVQLPPEREDGLLIRIMGSAVATWAAIRAAGGGGGGTIDPLSITTLRQSARERCGSVVTGAAERWSGEALALVSAGASRELHHGQAWKLLEGLGCNPPPVWDVLQVAHGPLQHFYNHRITLCALTVRGENSTLWDSLAKVLEPDRHHLIKLEATHNSARGWLEHDAMVNELLRAFYRRRPRDLVQWPGKDRDAPLYRLGK